MSILENEKIRKIYDTGKEGLKMVSEVGIGVLFGAFTQTFMPRVGIPTKAAVWIGTKIFTGFVTSKTDDYIDKTGDEIVEIIDDAITQVKEAAENGDRETRGTDAGYQI